MRGGRLRGGSYAAAACALLVLAPAVLRSDEGFYGAWVNLTEGNDLSKYWVTMVNWTLSDGVVRLEPRPGEEGLAAL